MNLKKWEGVYSKSVVTGPSSCEKRIYRAAVSQRLRNTGVEQPWVHGNSYICTQRLGSYLGTAASTVVLGSTCECPERKSSLNTTLSMGDYQLHVSAVCSNLEDEYWFVRRGNLKYSAMKKKKKKKWLNITSSG